MSRPFFQEQRLSIPRLHHVVSGQAKLGGILAAEECSPHSQPKTLRADARENLLEVGKTFCGMLEAPIFSFPFGVDDEHAWLHPRRFKAAIDGGEQALIE